jgi:hypothetical protein
MAQVLNSNLPDKAHLNFSQGAKRADRRACQRDSSLPPLVPGRVGRAEVNGRIRVYLPTTEGEVVYVVSRSEEWSYSIERQKARPSRHVTGASAVSPVARVRRAIDFALTELADIERRAHAVEQSPISTTSTAAD